MVQERNGHGRNQKKERDAMFLDQAKRCSGVEAFHEDVAPSQTGQELGRSPTVDVEQGMVCSWVSSSRIPSARDTSRA